MRKFHLYKQLDSLDCGPSCLRMIARHFGQRYSAQTLRTKCHVTREGTSMLGISDAAKEIGLQPIAISTVLEDLKEKVPCILHWNQTHFVVCYKISTRRYSFSGKEHCSFYIADPAYGKYKLSKSEAYKHWGKGKEGNLGTALILSPTDSFYKMDGDESKLKLSSYIKFLTPYKIQFIQLILGLLLASFIQLLLPFFTQSIVDVGIGERNLNFVTLVLIAQLILFVTQFAINLFKSWIILHMNVRINLSILSKFMVKLFDMPIRYFDSKKIGDILQRIGDHGRIESLLTGTTLYSFFSILNFIVFTCVLWYYNHIILLTFMTGSVLNIITIICFMKYRRELDYKQFYQSARNQSNIIQLITGMQEIKLNNSEQQECWNWEAIQIDQFKLNMRRMAIGQYQSVISSFISQITNITILYLSAKAVIENQITLGMMMSISYIIGQLSGPISQAISIILGFQDAKIALERINEIYVQKGEMEESEVFCNEVPKDHSIYINNVSFSYDNSERNNVLHNINLIIPQYKVTAIIGSSGSGKTTLLKLLTGFYKPNNGDIKIANQALCHINPHVWRGSVGCVMQDGFIFSDSIARNIAIGTKDIDNSRLQFALQVANLIDFVNSLPLGTETKIGMEGTGISQGQKQRILIARAVYKNPQYLFLDEATNSLDTQNEKQIMNNLNTFYQNKTVVVIAHRLSTVQNADNIVVIEDGKIVEMGNHKELLSKQGRYYFLMKSQLQQ